MKHDRIGKNNRACFWDKERIEKAYQLHQAGASVTSISLKFGASQDSLRQALKRHMLPINARACFWMKERVDRAYEIHVEKGWSVNQIAALYKTTPESLRKALRRHGYAINVKWNEERILEAYEMYKSGKTLRQVGEHYGITGAAICSIFKRSPMLCPPVRSGKLKVEQDHQHVTVDGECIGCGVTV